MLIELLRPREEEALQNGRRRAAKPWKVSSRMKEGVLKNEGRWAAKRPKVGRETMGEDGEDCG